MSLYSEDIRNRYLNDALLEARTDDSLYNNKYFGTDDKNDLFQRAVDYVLGLYRLTSPWVYDINNPEQILDAKLSSFDSMYEKIDTSDHHNIYRHGGYIIAMDEDGEVYVLAPGIVGYRYIRISDGKKGIFGKSMRLRPDAYGIVRPMNGGAVSLRRYYLSVLKLLSVRDIVPVILTMVIVSLLGLAAPKINKIVLSDVVDSGSISMLLTMLVLFLGAGILKTLITAVKSIMLNDMETRVSLQAQNMVLAKLLLLPDNVIRGMSSGKICRQVNQSRRLAGLVVGMVVDTSLTVLLSLIYVRQMSSYSAVLVLPALVMLLVKIIVSFVIALADSENENNDMVASMENSRFLFMSIHGVEKIKGNGAESRFYAHWAEIYHRMLNCRLEQPMLVRMEDVIISFITAFTTVLILGIAAPAGVTGADYMAFNTAYALIVTAVDEMLEVVNSLFIMKTLYKNIEPLLVSKTEYIPGAEPVRTIRGNIELEHVSFRYKDNSIPTLEDVSFSIRRGETVAITGKSGCGKSTLVNLLLGLEHPDCGIISYDSRPIESLELRSLRHNIATVLQSSSLIPGTIFDNIAFGKNDLTEEEAWEAARKACIDDYIRQLPLGLFTEVSETASSGFSGGQRQRILLARAFASKAPVMIFDESTSALDNLTQKKVIDEIYKENSTVIMIAHRLSTVKSCDRIIMLENGRVAETGTYQELMDINGSFAALVNAREKQDFYS